MKYLRMKQVIERIGLSKSTIWNMIREGSFPAQVRLTPRTSAWIEEEIDQWCKERVLFSSTSISLRKEAAPAIDKARPKIMAYKRILNLRRIEIVTLIGIYFLIDGDQIVYIGKSINVFARIAEHQRNNEKKFDTFTYIQIPIDQLDEFEVEYINAYKPKYNVVIPKADNKRI
jgi:prophage regulatory protein